MKFHKILILHKWLYWRIFRPITRTLVLKLSSIGLVLKNLDMINKFSYYLSILKFKLFKIEKKYIHVNVNWTKIIKSKAIPVQPISDIETRKPTLCVIITFYNQSEEELLRFFNSVYAQKIHPSKYLLIDGGSTNIHTVRMINEFCRNLNSKEISFEFIRIPNIGIVKTRNYGASIVSEKYILFFDPDDAMDPNFVYELEANINREIFAEVIVPNVNVYHGGKVTKWETGPAEINLNLVANRIPNSSAIKRELFMDLNGYSHDMEDGMEDYDLWIRAMYSGARFSKAPFAIYNYYDGSINSRTVRLKNLESKQYLRILSHLHYLIKKSSIY